MNTYPESVEFLYSLGNEVKTIKLGLERVSRILAALGNPERQYRVVHIAGTNGKGSTAAMVEAGLRVSGYRTGLFTSPHLVEPTERIRIGFTPITENRFLEAFNVVHETATRLVDEGEIDGHPTYFETVTAMGFWVFAAEAVDIAVIEVGLGGRLDATNVVRPELCAITPVDFDHEQWLGSTLRAIAGEKAGILKPGIPAVISPQNPEAMQRIEEVAREVGAPLEAVENWTVEGVEVDARGCRYSARRGTDQVDVECGLAGTHQVANSLTAAVALHLLGVPAQGIASACWPGRLEHIGKAPEILLDGAHNPAGVRALAAYLREFYRDRRIWVVYATMRDKSVQEAVDALSPLAYGIVATQVNSQRALRAEALAEIFDHPRVSVAQDTAAAIELTRQRAESGDVIVITGSLFLVGEARALLV